MNLMSWHSPGGTSPGGVEVRFPVDEVQAWHHHGMSARQTNASSYPKVSAPRMGIWNECSVYISGGDSGCTFLTWLQLCRSAFRGREEVAASPAFHPRRMCRSRGAEGCFFRIQYFEICDLTDWLAMLRLRAPILLTEIRQLRFMCLLQLAPGWTSSMCMPWFEDSSIVYHSAGGWELHSLHHEYPLPVF